MCFAAAGRALASAIPSSGGAHSTRLPTLEGRRVTAGLAATLMCLNVDLTYDKVIASGVSFAEGCKIESRAVDKGHSMQRRLGSWVWMVGWGEYVVHCQ